MALVHGQCPQCQRIDVVQYGQQSNGTQRYRCNNPDCPRTIFLLQYHDKGRLPAVKQQIVAMTLNGSGVRDIVRVLRVSSATVINVLKKKEPAVKQVNERLLDTLDPPHATCRYPGGSSRPWRQSRRAACLRPGVKESGRVWHVAHGWSAHAATTAASGVRPP